MAFKQKSYILKFAILKVTPTACGKYIIVTAKKKRKIGNGISKYIYFVVLQEVCWFCRWNLKKKEKGLAESRTVFCIRIDIPNHFGVRE